VAGLASAHGALTQLGMLMEGRALRSTLVLSNETLCEGAGEIVAAAMPDPLPSATARQQQAEQRKAQRGSHQSASSGQPRAKAASRLGAVLLSGAGVSGVTLPLPTVRLLAEALAVTRAVDAAVHTPVQRLLADFVAGSGVLGAAARDHAERLGGLPAALRSRVSMLADDPEVDHTHEECSDEPVLDLLSRELKSCARHAVVCAAEPVVQSKK
jgi:hypothetical protein